MEITEYCKVRLSDGAIVRVIDLTKPGEAYLVEVPTPHSDASYSQFFITEDQIVDIVSDDAPKHKGQ